MPSRVDADVDGVECASVGVYIGGGGEVTLCFLHHVGLSFVSFPSATASPSDFVPDLHGANAGMDAMLGNATSSGIWNPTGGRIFSHTGFVCIFSHAWVNWRLSSPCSGNGSVGAPPRLRASQFFMAWARSIVVVGDEGLAAGGAEVDSLSSDSSSVVTGAS